ncbi:hypothetical protein Tco_0314699, partial [Tanacetum coccineum]
IELREARGLSGRIAETSISRYKVTSSNKASSNIKEQQLPVFAATLRHSSSTLHALYQLAINSGVVSSLATRKVYVHGQLRTISTLST